MTRARRPVRIGTYVAEWVMAGVSVATALAALHVWAVRAIVRGEMAPLGDRLRNLEAALDRIERWAALGRGRSRMAARRWRGCEDEERVHGEA